MNKVSFEQLYMQQLPGFYRLAQSILRHTADAEDAVQQAVMKAWQRADDLPPGKEKPYLARIVINECRNIQRRRMRVFPVELPPAVQDMPPDYQDLYDAIFRLPEKLRLPLMLKYLQDCSEKEGAEALGISVTAFKARLHRARTELRKTLDREVMFE